MYDRILGGLIGAGAGDAMGAATEARTTEQILAYFGHEVTDFETPPMDTFGAGNVPGQLTDDFSSAYFVARHIADNHGEVTKEVVQEALIDYTHQPQKKHPNTKTHHPNPRDRKICVMKLTSCQRPSL